MRVLVDGAWGFAGSAVMTNPEVERVTREAIEIARASGLAAGDPVQLDDTPPQTARYCDAGAGGSVRRLDRRQAGHPVRGGRGHGAGFRASPCARAPSRAAANARPSPPARERDIEQELTEAGAGIEATAVDESESQVRSWPNSAGGQHVTGGFEAVRAMDLPGNAQRIAEEAVALLTAEECPSGRDDPA